MTPERLAQIHAAAFASERSWSAQEFATLIEKPFVALITSPHGFALTQTIAGESELLTLAVDPHHQGCGTGRALLRQWLDTVEATQAFLEVAADNHSAKHLYTTEGFGEISRRPGYYRRENAPNVDAIAMRRTLTKR